MLGRERFGLAGQITGELGLQLQRIYRLAKRQPEDPVGKGAADLFVIDQIDGQNSLTDATHAVQADPGCSSSDGDCLVSRAEQGLLQRSEILRPAKMMRSLAGDSVQYRDSARFGHWSERHHRRPLRAELRSGDGCHPLSCRSDLLRKAHEHCVAPRKPQAVQWPVRRMCKLIFRQRGRLVVAGSNRNREESDRFSIGVLKQRRQLLVADEVRSEEIRANEQDADAGARQRRRNVTSPFTADLYIGICPYVKAGKRL